jgi:Xaa-Pro aminopeptidase
MAVTIPRTDYQDRLDRAQLACGAAGLDALLLTPGPDLRYLTGYDAVALERLTCLVLPADGPIELVVPALEKPAAHTAGVGDLGVTLLSWQETSDPYRLVADELGLPGTVGVDDRMWASKLLELAEALDHPSMVPASVVTGPLRAVKSRAEIEALAEAAAAIDAVHARMGEWLRVGRTERDIARDIAAAVLAEGHERVDFVIVASGPNGSSPHHEAGGREVVDGDLVVVDIGGTTSAGYCSDCTRTYVMGRESATTAPEMYEVLQAAQGAAVAAARPGMTAGALDQVARAVIEEAGLGEHFVHRTGHGIGVETHEQPYIVAASEEVLTEGMAFSIEPGIYLPGERGARIEDIVVLTADGVRTLNQQTRELVQP